MREIQLSQGQVAIVDDEDFEVLAQYNWFAMRNPWTFYAARQTGHGKGNQKIQGMHRFLLNVTDPRIQVHHRDHNGLHNWRANIVACTHTQNQWNKSSARGSSSRFLGVYRTRWGYAAAIKQDGISTHLGTFPVEEDAARAYNRAALERREARG